MALWNQVLEERRPCVGCPVPTGLGETAHLFGDFSDFHAGDYRKSLCEQGAVCLARVEWKENSYTGLFQRSDYCLLRCSSAAPANQENPSCPIMGVAPGTLGKAVVFPFVALKVFRAGGRGSGNLLFGGRKTGQEEISFFANVQCSHFTERSSMVMWPYIRTFKKMSDFPGQSGLSDFASMGQDGKELDTPAFPWCLVIKALVEAKPDEDRHFFHQLDEIEPGTQMYRILACATPEDAKKKAPLTEIGRIVTVSKFVYSGVETKLRFRHQPKEEDFQIYPHWRSQMTNAHRNFGWEYFKDFAEATPDEVLPSSPWLWTEGEGEQKQEGGKEAPTNGTDNKNDLVDFFFSACFAA